jgi:hypothetical protein
VLIPKVKRGKKNWPPGFTRRASLDHGGVSPEPLLRR